MLVFGMTRPRGDIWIEIIQIAIKIECLHSTKFLDLDRDLDCNPDNFDLCERGI